MDLPHSSAVNVAPDEDAEQYVADVRDTRAGLRRSTKHFEKSHIWTTEHHLTAAAEALAETSLSIQVRHTRKSQGRQRILGLSCHAVGCSLSVPHSGIVSECRHSVYRPPSHIMQDPDASEKSARAETPKYTLSDEACGIDYIH